MGLNNLSNPGVFVILCTSTNISRKHFWELLFVRASDTGSFGSFECIPVANAART